ncbi:hypothetical protein LCGC14_0983190 [marine sediment metagenome]|uniref:DUF3291 domain-containing protein n=2 Tax=root TaxID=1 RepID=A0A831QPH9_9FLAO|nr:DUF3291 domain-containing protein [Pricia antarctica]
MSQITTLSIFKFSTLRTKLWAFGMMQFAHKPLSKISGQELYKLMGSGKASFNPLPDWSTYAILQIWENETAADLFFKNNPLALQYRQQSSRHWTLYMRNISAKGKWSGENPFESSDSLDDTNLYIAVITRATIRKRLLYKFWSYVPESQRSLEGNEGLVYTKGIGEVPFAQMATFSLWKNKASLMRYAYESEGHKKAISKTRQLNWYREELFSRFQPYRSEGALEEGNFGLDF